MKGRGFILGAISVGKVLFRPFYPTTIYGDKKLENKKCIYAGNHVSGWDAVVFTMYNKHVFPFVYKDVFRKSAFLRWVFDNLYCIPVKRGSIDMNASKTILNLLNNDNAVCLFPEGTRNPNVDCFLEFRTGTALYALKTHAPIRPFYIWEKSKPFRKNYIIFGDEFTLEEFYDKPISKEVLKQATEVIKGKLDALRIELNEILAKKGVKRRKRTKKELKKIEEYNKRMQHRQQLPSANVEQNGTLEDK